MKRLLLNLLTALSLLLFLATSALWVRSHWVEDGVVWRSNVEGYGFRVASFRGSLHLVEFASLGSGFLNPYSRPAEDEEEIPSFIYDFSALGIHYGSARIFTPGGPQWALAIPFWLPTLIAAATLGLLGAYRRRPLRKAGLCPTCSYDLRAHLPISELRTQNSELPPRCPECGTPIPPQPSQT